MHANVSSHIMFERTIDIDISIENNFQYNMSINVCKNAKTYINSSIGICISIRMYIGIKIVMKHRSCDRAWKLSGSVDFMTMFRCL